MATVESAIVLKLNTVSAIVGKVFPLNAKEGTALPYCVYVVRADEETDSLGGWLGSFDKEIEINLVAETYASMKALAASVAEKLKELNGTEFGGITFQAVWLDSNQPEVYEPQICSYRKIINIKTSI